MANLAAVESSYESGGLGAGATTDVTVPAGGDSDSAYLLLTKSNLAGAPAATPTCPGFAELSGSPADDTNFFGYTLHALRRDHDGSEGATFTVTSTDAVTEFTAVVLLINEAGDLDQTVAVAELTADITTLQQTTTEDDVLAIVMAAGPFGDITTPNPANYSPVTGSPFADSALGVYSYTQAVAGATPADTIAFDSGTSVATMTLCIRTSASTPTAPGDPTSIVATAGDGTAQLTWVDESTGIPAGTYDIDIAPDPHTVWSAVDTDLAAGVGVSNAAGLTNDTAYQFRIRAQNASGDNPSGYITSNIVTPTAASAVAGALATISGSGQAIPGTAFTNLDVGTIASDPSGLLSESGGIFTPQVEGYYLIRSHCLFELTHNNRVVIEHQIRRNFVAQPGAVDTGYGRNTANDLFTVSPGLIAHFNGTTDQFEVRHRRDTGAGTPAGTYQSTYVQATLLATGAAGDTPFAHYETPTAAAYDVAAAPSAASIVTGFDVATETDTDVIALQPDTESIRLGEAGRPILFVYGFPTDAAGVGRTQRVSDLTYNGDRIGASVGYAYQRDGANQYAALAGMGLVRPSAADLDVQARIWLYNDTQGAAFWGTMNGEAWTLASASGRAGIMAIALPATTNIAIFEDNTGGQTFSGSALLDLNVHDVPVGTVDAPFVRDNSTDVSLTADAAVLGHVAVMVERSASSGTRQSNAIRYEVEGVDDDTTAAIDYLRGEQGSDDTPNSAPSTFIAGDFTNGATFQVEKHDPGTDDGNNDLTAYGGAFYIDRASLAAATGPIVVELGTVVDDTAPLALGAEVDVALGLVDDDTTTLALTPAMLVELGTVVDDTVPLALGVDVDVALGLVDDDTVPLALTAGAIITLGTVVDDSVPLALTPAVDVALGTVVDDTVPLALGVDVDVALGLVDDDTVPLPLAAGAIIDLDPVVDASVPLPLAAGTVVELGVVAGSDVPQPIVEAGPDGILGTVADGTAAALPITAGKSVALGLVDDDTTPLAITRQAPTAILGTPTESSSPLPLTAVTVVALGLVDDDTVPLALIGATAIELGAVVDDTVPLPLAADVDVALGLVDDDTVPLALAAGAGVALGVVVDDSVPLALAAGKAVELGAVAGSDVPQPIVEAGPDGILGVVVDDTVPLALAAGTVVELGVVAGSDVPQPLTQELPTGILGTALDTSTAIPLAAGKAVELGTVVDDTAPLAVAAGTVVTLGTVADTSTPLPLAAGTVVELGRPTDATTPQGLGRVTVVTLGAVVDDSTPLALAAGTVVELGVVAGSDVPQPITQELPDGILGVVVDDTAPLALTAGAIIGLGTVVDDTAPLALNPAKSVALGTALDPAAALALLAAKLIALGLAIDPTTALPFYIQTGGRLVITVVTVGDPLCVISVGRLPHATPTDDLDVVTISH